jgi:hypothetical protein
LEIKLVQVNLTPENPSLVIYELRVEESPVTLSNGQWQGAPYVEGGASRPHVGLAKDFYITGDLNADGKPEAVVMLWQAGGGTGRSTYIAVMSRQNGEVKNISTALVGDRVKLRSAALEAAAGGFRAVGNELPTLLSAGGGVEGVAVCLRYDGGL